MTATWQSRATPKQVDPGGPNASGSENAHSWKAKDFDTQSHGSNSAFHPVLDG